MDGLLTGWMDSMRRGTTQSLPTLVTLRVTWSSKQTISLHSLYPSPFKSERLAFASSLLAIESAPTPGDTINGLCS